MSDTQETTDPRQALTVRVINATMLRTKTRDILEQAKFNGEHFVVETFGKPMVAIVGIDEYRELLSHARGTDINRRQESPESGEGPRALGRRFP